MNWLRSDRYLTALTPAGNPTPELRLNYDALDQLTALKDGSTGTVIDGYRYDGTGNRLSAKFDGAMQTYGHHQYLICSDSISVGVESRGGPRAGRLRH